MLQILFLLLLDAGNFASTVAEQPFEIVYINLDRRPEREVNMEARIPHVFPNFTYYRLPAIDGLNLGEGDLQHVKILPGYEDPILKRPMKYGEVACSLSHYQLWVEIVQRNWPLTLILEDDANFLHSQFEHRSSSSSDDESLVLYRDYLSRMLHEALNHHRADFIYIGRKPMQPDAPCEECSLVVKPGYSYWTVAYFITLEGSSKLLRAQPLQHMVPVDEFLPFMYGQHPKQQEWKSLFPSDIEELVAVSSAQLLVQPDRFVGEEEYISDTETSHIIPSQTCTHDDENTYC